MAVVLVVVVVVGVGVLGKLAANFASLIYLSRSSALLSMLVVVVFTVVEFPLRWALTLLCSAWLDSGN